MICSRRGRGGGVLFSNLRRRDDYDCPGCPKDACCWWETHREYERDSFLKKLRGSMSTALESFFDRKGTEGQGREEDIVLLDLFFGRAKPYHYLSTHTRQIIVAERCIGQSCRGRRPATALGFSKPFSTSIDRPPATTALLPDSEAVVGARCSGHVRALLGLTRVITSC